MNLTKMVRGTLITLGAAVSAACGGGDDGKGGCGNDVTSPDCVKTPVISFTTANIPASALVNGVYRVQIGATTDIGQPIDSIRIGDSNETYKGSGSAFEHDFTARATQGSEPINYIAFSHKTDGTAVSKAGSGAVAVSNAPDVTPPSITSLTPLDGTILPAGTTNATITALTNEDAECRESSSPATPYASMTPMNGTQTSHTLGLTGLVNGQNVPAYVLCKDPAGNLMTTPSHVTFSVANPTPVTKQFRVQLVDMDGNPVTQAHAMPIDGTNYNSNASGVITAQLSVGTHTIGYARRSTDDSTAARLELPASYQNNVRIIFPRFKIDQNAAAGQDTVTVTQDVDARAVVAGLGSNFNKEHYSGYFDDELAGQQGIRGSTVRFHILTQPNAALPLCQPMAAGALSTYRQFQQTQSTDLASNYTVVNTEGTTLPSGLNNGEYVILCQGPIVGNETFRDSDGAYTFSVAYVGAVPTLGEVNAEALLAPYGSSGIEGKCAVPSVFNDSNLADPSCTIGSTTPTQYDRREGLEMMKSFAQPANDRARNTSTTQFGTSKIYFSLRKAQ